MINSGMVDVFVKKIKDLNINVDQKWSIYGTGEGSTKIIAWYLTQFH